MHKKICAKYANAELNAFLNNIPADHSSTYSPPRLKNLDVHIANPFTKLDEGKFLYDRTQKDVFKLLIDSFRLRQADEANLEGKVTPNSLYIGAASGIGLFRQYLAKAGTIPNLLPPWWNAEKKKECEEFGESGAWSDLRTKVSKQEVIEHYGDGKAPMQIRMLAEAIIGMGIMGQNGAGMRKMMMEMERPGPGSMESTLVDVSKQMSSSQV